MPRICGGYTQPWRPQATTAEPWKHPSVRQALLEHEKSLLEGGAQTWGELDFALLLRLTKQNMRESRAPPRGLVSVTTPAPSS